MKTRLLYASRTVRIWFGATTERSSSFGRVVKVHIEIEVTDRTRPLVANRHLKPALAGLDRASVFGDARLDPVDLVADVDAVGDGFLVGVFGDEVLLEEAVGAPVGGGGEADQKGVEVFEDLPPEVVDRAVALIDDDEVEELGRDLFVVDDGERLLALRTGLGGVLLVLALGHFPPLEDGIHPLDGGDADLGICGDVGGGEALGGVDGGEGAVVVGGGVGDELLLGLLAEVAGIDEEEDAANLGVLEEAVDGGDGGEGLAGAGGHLDQGAGLGLGEGGFEVGDGIDLAVAQASGVERGQVLGEAAAGGRGQRRGIRGGFLGGGR